MSEELTASDKHYFKSYDHFGIHEEMLKDQVRTIAYRDAIYHNRDQFKDKVVLDVGCGSGILSMFAANAGAKHVIGVDRSDIIDMARKVVETNGLSHKITLIKGKMEEITLPFDQVDIIVSEWMGYFLLYEAMLDTVLYARDRYLRKDGLILPDKASMYMASIEDAQYKNEKIGFWKNVYGFDYSPFHEVAISEPLVDTVDFRSLVSDSCKLITFDLYTVTKEDLAFSVPFKLETKSDDMVHGFVIWFDVEFSRMNNDKVTLTTSPEEEYTHWKQTVIYTRKDHFTRVGDHFVGRLSIKPNEHNPRDIDIECEYEQINVHRHQDAGKQTLTFLMR